MSAVEVSALVFREFDGARNKPSYALIKLSKTFTTSNGVRRLKSSGSKFYKRVEVTDNLNGTYTMAGMSGVHALDSTTDGQDSRTATYRVEVYSARGTLLGRLFSGIRVPPTPSTTTWNDLTSYTVGATTPPTDNWYNAILSLFSNISTAPFASEVVVGKMRLSYPALDPALPTALSVTDPKLHKYLGAFEDLADAVATIGGSNAILTINQDTTPAANINIPANILVEFGENGLLRPSSTYTVTIGAMLDVGTRQVFGGNGDVVLAKGAVQEMNLAWWAGKTNNGDVSRAFAQAKASLVLNGGGILNVPAGVWKANNIGIPSGATIQGAGTGTSGINETVLKLYDEATPSSVVLINDVTYRSCTLKNLTVSTGASTVSNCVRTEGSYPNTSAGLEFNNVIFQGTGVASPPQVYIKDLYFGWELIGVKFDHCSWVIPSNSVGFKCDSNNNSVTFVQPFFYIGVGAEGMLLEHFGAMSIYNPTFNGISTLFVQSTFNRTVTATITNGSNTLNLNSGSFNANDIGQRVSIGGVIDANITKLISPTSALLDEAAVGDAAASNCAIYRYTPNSGMAKAAIRVTGSHGTLGIFNSQDEGLRYFLINEGSQLQYPISIVGCLIQSTILLTESKTIFSSGNAYFSQTYTDGVNASAQIFSQGDYIDKTSVNILDTNLGVELAEARLFGVRNGGSVVVADNSNYQGETRNRFNASLEIRHGEEFVVNPERTKPVFGAFSSSNSSGGVTKPQIRFGRLSPVTNEPDLYYDAFRDYDSGMCRFVGNQDYPDKGYEFDAPMVVEGSVIPASVALVDEATILTDAKLGNTFKVTLTANRLLGAPTNPTDGQICRWWIKQNQDGNHTLTLQTGVDGFIYGTTIPNTTLTTAAGKSDVIEAQYDLDARRWRVTLFAKGY